MTEPTGYHDFVEPCNIKFTSATLKFKDPAARKPYEPKGKDGKPIELTAEQKKKKGAPHSETQRWRIFPLHR